MRERAEPLLKLVCAGLGLVLAAQLLRWMMHASPLSRVEMPEVPTWSASAGDSADGAPGAGPGVGAGGDGIPASARSGHASRPPGMTIPGMGMRGPGGPGQELPAAIQPWGSRIIQSGLLGPVIRPPPMALLGIAGDSVFLRGPDGQMGTVRPGEMLGGVKLVRIGTNRVLVLENGEEKELSIFGGLGGESLQSPKKEATP